MLKNIINVACIMLLSYSNFLVADGPDNVTANPTIITTANGQSFINTTGRSLVYTDNNPMPWQQTTTQQLLQPQKKFLTKKVVAVVFGAGIATGMFIVELLNKK